MRILFVVKRRHNYCDHGHGHCNCHDHDSSPECLGGLFNSAQFVVQMLNQQKGITASLVQVIDNNGIDCEVRKFKPDTVVIEALWVVPQKFHLLTRLHPAVQWIVRLHSEIPFLGMEGVAMEWISDYVKIPKVSVALNSETATRDVRAIIRAKFGDFEKVEYLPNWYPSSDRRVHIPDPNHLNVACFGAIRPLKNQLIQAVAAIQFANSRSARLKYHINATRCEQRGENVLKNIRALFKGTGHQLVEHAWESHDQFLHTMSRMDVSMSVSFSETFNIISADAATSNVPLVVSSQVSWASPHSFAKTHDAADIVRALDKVTSSPFKWLTVKANLKKLRTFDKSSTATWLRFLK